MGLMVGSSNMIAVCEVMVEKKSIVTSNEQEGKIVILSDLIHKAVTLNTPICKPRQWKPKRGNR